MKLPQEPSSMGCPSKKDCMNAHQAETKVNYIKTQKSKCKKGNVNWNKTEKDLNITSHYREPHKHQLKLFKDEFLKILCLSENATQV